MSNKVKVVAIVTAGLVTGVIAGRTIINKIKTRKENTQTKSAK